jgi:hypothetical protein
MSIPYYHVDSFTEDLFGGNPAGVCTLSAFLVDDTMQKIAAEKTNTPKPHLSSLGPTVISTSAGSHLKLKTIYAGTQPWIRLRARLAGTHRVAGALPYPQRCVDGGT